MAYELFDGKYSIHDLGAMPYHELIENIEREQKFQNEFGSRREKREAKEIEENL